MKYSILDQVPQSRGTNFNETVQQTIETARYAESLGFHRYWFAEHHNTTGLLSNSPELWMTRMLSETSRIRVGSGGILLPQYSPYKIAETAKTIELMFAGRVDIGTGNSPGGAELTRKALHDGQPSGIKEYERKLRELQGFIYNKLPMEHEYRTVKAGPRINHYPELYSLGLTVNGAKRAADLGIGFVFGHFLNPKYGVEAIQTYRQHFKPSDGLTRPYVIMCVFVLCLEDEELLTKQARTQDQWLLNINRGGSTTIPSYEEIRHKEYRSDELNIISNNRERCLIGNKEEVKRGLVELISQYQTDELMVITNIHSVEAKRESYSNLSTIINEL